MRRSFERWKSLGLGKRSKEENSGRSTTLDPSRKPKTDPKLEQQAQARYRDQGEIGAGGMSTVRQAQDKNLLRRVALKRLKTDMAFDRDRIQRFVEEAQITGQLDHPNIVPIHELDTDVDGVHYFTMKQVQGRNLKEILKRAGEARLDAEPLRESLKTLVKVCEAISFAHSRGVIHRDLKPSNIMVGEFGQVYVMDWGVARLLPDAKPDQPFVDLQRDAQTADPDVPGTVVGTPGYMAPEQVEGHHDRVDERTDVFALGATLYHILTGRAPYQATTYYTQLLEALACNAPTPEEIVGDGRVPPELSVITRRAMAADQEDRYTSVHALQKDLEKFMRSFWHLPSRKFQPEVDIVKQGAEGNTAYIITHGECQVLIGSAEEQVEVRRLGPGDVFGETAIFSQVRRTATVRTLTEVTALEVTREALTDGLGLNSWMGRFVTALADRFREVEERLHKLEQTSQKDEPLVDS